MYTNLLDYFESSVKTFPNKTALADENHSLSYEEVSRAAKSIASFISQKKVHNRPVAVFIDRNIESVVAFWGIIYSGNFYVPIDCQLPSKRIELILNTLEPEMIINCAPPVPAN